jgi:ubiquinone/menaquinone biosynthesis C-methylase UbiE
MNAGKQTRIFVSLIVFALLTSCLPAQSAFEERRERWDNERQPPGRVMDAVGVKPGLVIGEVGAGRGRYTVYLAERVGQTGKVYAEDIDRESMDYLRDRVKKAGLSNVEAILGEVDDPLFPKGSVDIVFFVLSYHHLADPVTLLKNLIPCLKPGAVLAVIDPDSTKDPGSRASEYTSREKIESEAGEAGFELVRVETFLAKDNLFILRVKTA